MRTSSPGFSLLEILVAVVIVGIIGTIAIVQFADVREQAYVSGMKSDLRNFAAHQVDRFSEEGHYPTYSDDAETTSPEDLVDEMDENGWGFSSDIFPVIDEDEFEPVFDPNRFHIRVGHEGTETRCEIHVATDLAEAPDTGEIIDQRVRCFPRGEGPGDGAGEGDDGGEAPVADFTAEDPDLSGSVDLLGGLTDPYGNPFRAGRSLVLDGTLSYSPEPEVDIVDYDWQIEALDDAEGEAQVTRTFADPGNYTVTLVVTDSEGRLSQPETRHVEVDDEDLGSPIASFDGPDVVDLGSTGVFSSEAEHTNDNLARSDLEHTWRFDGDVFSDDRSEAGRSMDEEGSFTVTLEVEDPYGNTDTDDGTVQVDAPDCVDDPVADLELVQGDESSGLYTFSVADSEDPGDTDAEIEQYSIDFGDGTTRVLEAGSFVYSSVPHSYEDAGTYTVELTVTDDEGCTDTDELSVSPEVEGEGPVAVLEIDPGTATSPDAAIAFDSRDSHTADSDAEIDWEHSGNVLEHPEFSSWDTPEGDEVRVHEHAFNTEGTFEAMLVIHDTEGRSATTTTTHVIQDSNGGDLPTAEFEYTPESPSPEETVQFDGSLSTPSSEADEIVTWRWDMGDGTTQRGEFVDHVYDEPGIYEVSLVVTDDEDLTSLPTTQEVVVGSCDVTASFVYAPSEPIVGEGVTFDASASTAGSDCGEIEEYFWSFDDGSSATLFEPLTEHTYSVGGIYDVRLTVTTTEGQRASAEEEVDVDGEVDSCPTFTPSSDSPIYPPQSSDRHNVVHFNATPLMQDMIDQDLYIEDGWDETVEPMTWEFDVLDSSADIDGGESDSDTPYRFSTEIPFDVLGDIEITVTGVYYDDDGDGDPERCEYPQTVVRPSPHESPHAAFHWTPNPPMDDDEVTFDASFSKAYGGRTIESYTWEIEGDPESPHSGSGLETLQYTFEDSGTYDVTLTVMDSEGDEDSVTHPVMVEEGEPGPTKYIIVQDSWDSTEPFLLSDDGRDWREVLITNFPNDTGDPEEETLGVVRDLVRVGDAGNYRWYGHWESLDANGNYHTPYRMYSDDGENFFFEEMSDRTYGYGIYRQAPGGGMAGSAFLMTQNPRDTGIWRSSSGVTGWEAVQSVGFPTVSWLNTFQSASLLEFNNPNTGTDIWLTSSDGGTWETLTPYFNIDDVDYPIWSPDGNSDVVLLPDPDGDWGSDERWEIHISHDGGQTWNENDKVVVPDSVRGDGNAISTSPSTYTNGQAILTQTDSSWDGPDVWAYSPDLGQSWVTIPDPEEEAPGTIEFFLSGWYDDTWLLVTRDGIVDMGSDPSEGNYEVIDDFELDFGATVYPRWHHH